MQKYHKIALVLGVVILGLFLAQKSFEVKPLVQITNFEQCAAAGFPIRESYPATCSANGKTFVQEISSPAPGVKESILPGESRDMSVIGETVCLPHKQKGGVQTLECAFGLKDAQGMHFALRDPQMKFITTLPMGKKVTVMGKLDTRIDPKNIYDIAGIIDIEDVTVLE
jgi:hypothetical protein